MAGQVENTRARRNCVKALFLRSSVKRYDRVSRARVDFSSPFRPFLRLFSILLSPCRLFTPWLLSFFQSRRCNDSNLEVRTRHTRRQPTPISPLHRVTFSLSLFLPPSLPPSLSIMMNDSEASFSCCISNARSRRASTCLKGRKDEEEEKEEEGVVVEGSRSGTETGGRESDARRWDSKWRKKFAGNKGERYV